MSTIPTVCAALVVLAESTFDSDDWNVIDGPATAETSTGQRFVAVGDTEIIGPSDLAVVSGSRVHDRYTVPILVSVALPGPDALPTARTLALAAYESFRDAIRALMNLGLEGQGVLQALPVGEFRVQQFAPAEGRSVAVRFGVEVIAQGT